MRRLSGVILATVALSACGPALPSGDHLVDGYWLRAETRCPDLASGGCAAPVGETARLALLSAEPGAAITGASTAQPDCAQQSGGQPCVYGGLAQPVVVVFDLADGSRRAVGLLCDQSGDGPASCRLFDARRPGAG